MIRHKKINYNIQNESDKTYIFNIISTNHVNMIIEKFGTNHNNAHEDSSMFERAEEVSRRIEEEIRHNIDDS